MLLRRAIKKGHLEIVEFLIKECKANINEKNELGETPLFIAVKNEHLEIIKFLVEQCKADTKVTDMYGCTLLFAATSNKHTEIVKYLVEECKVDVNSQNNNGWTVLHEAAWFGYTDYVRYLVKTHKIDPNIQDYKKGATPLHCAVHMNKIEIVSLLIKNGAHIDVQDKHKNTPLEQADIDCHKAIYDLIKTHKDNTL